MSKKRFSDGLDNLFEVKEQEQDNISVELQLESEAEKNDFSDSNGSIKRSSRLVVSRQGKNFTSDLDTLLEDALMESLEQGFDNNFKKDQLSAKMNISKKSEAVTGLDALIRRTIDNSGADYEKGVNLRRVTFTFDKLLLSKLKSIARTEKSYLKDIVNQIVEGYIQTYEKKRGGYLADND